MKCFVSLNFMKFSNTRFIRYEIGNNIKYLTPLYVSYILRFLPLIWELSVVFVLSVEFTLPSFKSSMSHMWKPDGRV